MRPTAPGTRGGCAAPIADRTAEQQRVAPARSDPRPVSIGRCTARPSRTLSAPGIAASTAIIGASGMRTATTTGRWTVPLRNSVPDRAFDVVDDSRRQARNSSDDDEPTLSIPASSSAGGVWCWGIQSNVPIHVTGFPQ